ncbi:hypothetical protein RclHR1_11880008 [Rhizophagus clarus]|uniref:Uncharacterized protein n=1 Tax=Rhizophagus clarus TaxID=94130 RepID=A0A2Z6Q701_9GLOM|nr:hypothetical protein RclHR1_11880008 [Rhizophagus clarus]
MAFQYCKPIFKQLSCGQFLEPSNSSKVLKVHDHTRAWVKNLLLVVENINNSITHQIGISPVEAIEKEEVFAKSSYSHDGLIGFDEEKLSGDILVQYLLYPSDLKCGRCRAGDLNWSPHIYHIC